MALSEIKQASSILDRASDLLLIVPEKPSIDALCSMIALYLSLQTRAEHPSRQSSHLIDEVSPSHLPAALQFLAGSSQVKTEPTKRPEVVLDMIGPSATISVRQKQLSEGVRLHIAFPPGTTITKDQLETSIRLLPYEAVVVIGAADLEELGAIFTSHADFFYSTPVINIDHRAANEHFGTVNVVDITAGSCAEVTYDLITNQMSTPTPDIATALYAGIVAGTDSFQNPSTTPRSFQVAASLIEQDADREAVTHHLIKTKPLKLIKLIGSIYARLRYEEQAQLYWTALEADDFAASGASSHDIAATMHELTNNIAGFNAAFLLYETSGQKTAQVQPDPTPTGPVKYQQKKYRVYLLLGKGLKQRRREIQELLRATKENGALTFSIIAPSIEAAEKTAHDKIRQILP